MSGKTDLAKRRRTLIVDAPLQRAFVVDVALIPTLAMGVTTIIVAAFCHRLRLEAEQSEAELGSLVPLFVSFACFVIASGFAVVYQAVRISNRVAGPQVNMRRVVDSVIAGDHSARVRLRDGDFMVSAGDDINRLIKHFTAKPAQPVTPLPAVDSVAAIPVSASAGQQEMHTAQAHS
jgi:hypothetical protein